MARAGRVTVRRLVSNDQLERDALKAWKRASRRILKELIKPKTPRDEGELVGSLWQRTVIAADGNVVTTFSARAPHAPLYEIDEEWIATHTLRTPGTRAPYIAPALEEAEDIYREAVEDFVHGR